MLTTLLIALAVLPLLFVIWAYNRMVRLRAWCDEALSGVEVQLKRRHDLIPKLEAVVQGYAGHESALLQSVAEARARAMQAASQGLAARSEAESGLGLLLPKIFALAEAYPQLRANENFLELQRQISEIEDALQLSRRYFNACIRDHNSFGMSFPMNLVSSLLGFRHRPYFQLEGGI
jgi:LemA protein